MIIGLTGLTGAGKSTAAAVLSQLGCHIIDADRVGHRVTARPDILEKIKASFGEEYITSDGALDRRKLGALVFADRDKLQLLNSITHPPITEEIISEARAAEADGKTVVIDCALLGEVGLSEICRPVLNITAPTELRLGRIIERDGLSEAGALDRINSQRPYDGPAIDIENSSSQEALEARLKEALWQEERKI